MWSFRPDPRSRDPRGSVNAIPRRLLPKPLLVRIRGSLQRIRRLRPIGGVQFGSLDRSTPISRVFGLDRGVPVDRYYIERFLEKHQADIKGSVLEVGEARYTRQFGSGQVVSSDVLHVTSGNPNATIVGDLADGSQIPTEAFDCVICTQTLQFIYRVSDAITTLNNILRPGGVLLATLSGISQISRYDMDRWGDYWRFTPLSTSRLFQDNFTSEDLLVESHGNVFTAVAQLHGIALQEIAPERLASNDEDYPVLITVRARKAGML